MCQYNPLETEINEKLTWYNPMNWTGTAAWKILILESCSSLINGYMRYVCLNFQFFYLQPSPWTDKSKHAEGQVAVQLQMSLWYRYDQARFSGDPVGNELEIIKVIVGIFNNLNGI